MDKLQIRATQLETFRICPFRYKFEERVADAEHFRFGSALHKYIELLLNWTLNDTTQSMILNDRWVKERLMIIKMWNLFDSKVKEKWYELVCSEWTTKTFFEDLNTVLEGTFDHLFKNKEWQYVLVDAKTASSKRTQEHKDGVKQYIIYPSLLKKRYWLDISVFEYWVMTKTSNPQLEDINFTVPVTSVEDVEEKVKDLVHTTETGVRTPNFPNHTCFFCKLRDRCRTYKPIT